VTYSKTGYFGYAGGGKDGAIVDMWLASRFTTAPSQDTQPPGSTPDAGPVTTGETYGGPGAYTITGITAQADYYVRVQYGGHTYWTECSAGSLAGAGGTSLSYYSGSISGTVSLPGTSVTTIMSSASLATGIWLVNAGFLIQSQAHPVGYCEVWAAAGTATVTFTGQASAQVGSLAAVQNAGSSTAEMAPLSFVATVTTAGTIAFNSRPEASGDNMAAVANSGTRYPTDVVSGYTAVKIG
jgi:hypothetical protein